MNLKDKLTISRDEPARNALQRLTDLAMPGAALFVLDKEGRVVGTLTDGDIRRALLGGSDVKTPLSEIANANFRFLTEARPGAVFIDECRRFNIRYLPVLNAQQQLLSIIDLNSIKGILPVEAVLMAGGKGERLRPLTDDTPKPLLKVGGRPIIERNIERLISYSISRFHITVRYLGEKIERYLGDGSTYNAVFSYLHEDHPLGTIGALRSIGSFSEENILVMNSDLLTNIDFGDFYNFFVESGADMVVATVPYHVDIPYAVLETTDEQEVLSFLEKPRYTYYSNAGIYLLKKKLVDLVPANEKFDATDLMEAVIAKGYKLKSYPVVGYWLDIGRMEDYRKAQEDVKHIQF
ncbi:MAG TPA: nucleotidyltransferase family protein [Bacteroidia bacterium]|nr:nucleotidyltransferase family protein [Bacteroidia bacterium]